MQGQALYGYYTHQTHFTFTYRSGAETTKRRVIETPFVTVYIP